MNQRKEAEAYVQTYEYMRLPSCLLQEDVKAVSVHREGIKMWILLKTYDNIYFVVDNYEI